MSLVSGSNQRYLSPSQIKDEEERLLRLELKSALERATAAEARLAKCRATLTPTSEQIARIIDPSRWSVLDSYLADTQRKYGDVHAGYDPASFKDQISLAKADEILALIREALATSRRSRGRGGDQAGERAEGEMGG